MESRRLLSTVSGVVYDDLNRDVLFNAGDRAVANLRVYADTNYNGSFETTEPSVLTTADGRYTLNTNGLPAAIRLITTGSYQNVGKPFYYTNAGAAVDTNRNFTLANPTTAALAVVYGNLFDDTNSNGVMDSNESLAPTDYTNDRVYADLNNNQALDAGEPSARNGYQPEEVGGYRLVVPRGIAFTLRLAPGVGSTQTKPAANAGIAIDLRINSIVNVSGNDFGIHNETSVIYGTVFAGSFQDDPWYSGPRGGAGHRVYFDSNQNRAYDAGEPSALTNAAGEYRIVFQKPVPGTTTYDIGFVPAPGSYAYKGGDYVAVQTGETVWSRMMWRQSFGVQTSPGPSFTGSVFNDANRNGIRDANETGIPNRKVYLKYLYDTDTSRKYYDRTAVSDANGNYTFTNVQPINYRVLLVAQNGDINTNYGDRNLLIDENGVITSTPADFGLAFGTAISGSVFNDPNSNGYRDIGEVLIGGSTVYADYDYDSVLDADEPSIVVGSNGQFTLPTQTRSFALRIVPVSGQTLTTTSVFYFNYIANQWYGGGDTFGVHVGTVSPPSTNTITATAYLDANQNGRRDAGESGVAGQTIFADYNYNFSLDAGEPSTLTNANGNATLNVANKPFALRIISGVGYVTAGVQYFTPNASGGFQSSGNTFAVMPYGGGEIWLTYFPDQNNDGVQQAGLETDLANEVFDLGASAFIDFNNNGVFDGNDIRSSADTGHLGTYGYYFAGLVPGTYHVVVASNLPSGQSIAGGASKLVTVGTDRLTVTSAVLGVDFTKTRLSVLAYLDTVVANGKYDEGEALASGTTVFADYNYNGVLDAGEPSDVIGEAPQSPGQAINFPPDAHLLVRTGPLSLRFIKPDGTPALLPYGATSLWATLPATPTKAAVSAFIH